ncbi:MAG: hypothetical protein KAH48_11470 [Chlorobi bacterium]|nr:hypothetical protein [Chlorobiota bacterium]
MKHWKSLAFILSFALILTSCIIPSMHSIAYPYLTINRAAVCSRGDALNKYVIDGKPGNFRVKIQNLYRLNYAPNGSEIVSLIFKYEQGKRIGQFILAFENKKLLFWGFPAEFLSSKNDKIRLIGEETANRIMKDL